MLLRAVHLPAAGLYPVLTVAIAFAAFGATTLLEGSGFLAVYLTAVILADAPLPYRAGIRRAAGGRCSEHQASSGNCPSSVKYPHGTIVAGLQHS